MKIKVIDYAGNNYCPITKGQIWRRTLDDFPNANLVKEAYLLDDKSLEVIVFLDSKTESTETQILKNWKISQYDDWGKVLEIITKSSYKVSDPLN